MWFSSQGNALYLQMAQFAQKILEGKKLSEMQVKCFRLAVDDRAGFLDHDLVGEEGFGAAFASPSCYGSHLSRTDFVFVVPSGTTQALNGIN
jgi:hypothetical protein